MTTYTLGDRITVRLKPHGAARDGEFVEQRGSRCKVLLDDEMDVRTVRMDQVSPVPARVAPMLPPATPTLVIQSRDGSFHVGKRVLQPVPKPPKRWESAAYLAYVRASESCACCESYPTNSDPMEASHHGPRGMGRKSDDTRAIPLLRSCHRYYHQHGVFRGPRFTSPPHEPRITREQTDARAAETAARLTTEWCRMQGIDVDTIIINALTEALRERET